MTIRNLDTVFRPRSVALVGASERMGSIGRWLFENLLGGGFAGSIYAVNPRHATVLGRPAYPNVASLPEAPDLAVIATPPAAVPELIAALAARGTRGAVIVSAGFADQGEAGRKLQQAVLEAAQPALLRVVGPNTLGVLVPGLGLNASFAHLRPAPGRVAFLAQSGAIATSVLDWAAARDIGFSHVVALGDMADVDFGDMLDYLANDRGTDAVLLYVETITHARKFMSAARAASRTKPVIVVKSGRHAASASAAASHTGRLAGEDSHYAAAFRRAGMLRVATLEELFDAVETLALARQPSGPRLAIVSNGGGPGVMAADALLDRGGVLAAPSPETLAGLDELLPAAWSHANPVDVVGDADAARFAAALEIVLADPAHDAVLVLHCPTAVAPGVEVARAVGDVLEHHPRASVFTSWLGAASAAAARTELARRRVPTYDTPEQAVRAFMELVDYRHNQELLVETPPSLPELFTPDTAAARRTIDAAIEAGRPWLTEPAARGVLAAYGVPCTAAVEARSPEEAAAAARSFDRPVALKIVAPGVLHKSDVGGVALNLAPSVVAVEAERMLARVRAARADLEIEGFVVEPMIERKHSLELLIGATGGDFGPVIVFGEGGTAVEITADTAVELPPLNLRLARELIERTRVARKMHGFRDVPAVDIDAVALVLTRVAQLLVDCPEVLELDVNPLVADPKGVIALDARIKVCTDRAAVRDRLAIRPYPKELEQPVEVSDGRTLLLRPIVPEDEPALRGAFARLSPEDIRARFFVPMKDLPRLTAARFTQIDYDREMALVLADPGIPGKSPIHAVVRLVADPDLKRAEFAIVVDRPLSGRGLGTLLMHRIVDYARSRGIAEVWGDVLVDNAVMRGLSRSLGFTETPGDGDGVVRVTLRP